MSSGQTLLAVPEEDESVRSVVSVLRQQKGLKVETFSSFEAVIGRKANLPRPSGVLTKLDQRTPGFLELAVALDSEEAPHLPLLALVNGGLMRELPVETGPALVLADAGRPIEDLLAAVRSLVSGKPETQLFRQGVGYILPSVLSRRSVSLDLRSSSGLDAFIEIVGGDVWNAYSGDLTAIPAIESILYESIDRIEAKTLHTIPGERQLFLSGLQALSPHSRRQSVGPGPRAVAPKSRFDLGTQEIVPPTGPPEAVLPAAESRGSRTESAPRSETDQEFAMLLNEGIQASLARDYRRAAEAFEKALLRRPEDPKAKFNLARVRRRLKH